MSGTRTPHGDATTKLPDGIPTTTVRVGQQLEAIQSKLHGDLWELSNRGDLFFAASQAATTTSVALHTTHTGFCLSNPAASGVNLELHRVGIALSVGPVALTHLGLAGGYAAAGVVTHTTALTVYNTKLGVSAAAANGLADGAATLVGTPVHIMPLISSPIAAAAELAPVFFDIAGAICVPPGGYVFIQGLTASIGFFAMWWSEWTE